VVPEQAGLHEIGTEQVEPDAIAAEHVYEPVQNNLALLSQ